MIEIEDAPVHTRAQVDSADLQLQRISPTLGVEVQGVDLGQTLSDAQVQSLRQALVAHKVLVFRDQPITSAQHVAFAARFGELEVHPVLKQHPEHPELVLLGGDSQRPGGENVYHSDVSWREVPSMASVLRCVECPEVGGDTVWVNMELAYERLPEHRKRQIEKLYAVHDILPSFGASMTPQAQAQARSKYPPVMHPVVCRHPESGRKILYINEIFATHFANFTSDYSQFRSSNEIRSEQQDLMDYLLRQPAILEYQMRLKWQPNTIVMWDNRSTQHYAIQDYFPAVRRMQRATIVGTRPMP